SEADYLKGLGAAEIIERTTLSAPGKPLGKEQWAAAVDSVGATTLANVLAQTRYGGAVAACGNAGGMDLPARGLAAARKRPRSRQARRNHAHHRVRRGVRRRA